MYLQLNKVLIGLFFLPLLFALSDCTSSEEKISPLGEMIYPEDNQQTEGRVALGRKLFFDKRLSSNNTISCSSCHIPQFAFTDRRSLSFGVNGRVGTRNAPTVLNSGYLETLMYDAHIETLEEQAIVPIQDHAEMNIPMGELVEKLKNVEEYNRLANQNYDRDFDAWVLTRSLSAFQRSLISDNSKFDKYMNGDVKLSKEEENGWKLFSEKLYCIQCHPAPHFTTFKAENNGLYLDYGEDKGRFRIFSDSNDIGKFKIPSLRNVSITFPYMHDGSMMTLDDVVNHYADGGNGHLNQNELIKSFKISKKEKQDLIKFLETLTDTTYLEEFN